MISVDEMKKEKGRGRGKRGLTTADAEVKCDVDEGVTCDEHLCDRVTVNSETRRRGEGVTYSDKRSESTKAVITKG
jgi:hypothetical protein